MRFCRFLWGFFLFFFFNLYKCCTKRSTNLINSGTERNVKDPIQLVEIRCLKLWKIIEFLPKTNFLAMIKYTFHPITDNGKQDEEKKKSSLYSF